MLKWAGYAVIGVLCFMVTGMICTLIVAFALPESFRKVSIPTSLVISASMARYCTPTIYNKAKEWMRVGQEGK